MSRLKVMLRGALISEIELQNDREYIGGRKEGSDIRLQAEKGISREHFRMKFTEGRWLIEAVSRFGDVFSMGQKVDQVALEHGQSFQIPPYEFQLSDVPDAEQLDIPNPFRDLEEYNENEKTVLNAAPQVPYIKMVNPSGEVRQMLRLELGEVWSAGRDPSCQIIIPDQRVSRRQFEVHKVNGHYTILDLGSVNGTFLNGSPVSSTDPQSLKSGDAITVLDNTMYFELHDPNFKYKMDKIEIPPISIETGSGIEEFDEDPQPPIHHQTPANTAPQMHQDPGPYQAGGPFTGMPPGEDPNQFYTFNGPEQPPPFQKISAWKKFTKNKPLVLLVAILFLGGAYFASEMLTASDEIPNATATVSPIPKRADQPPVAEGTALSKLTPEQQKQVEEFYVLAQHMLEQQKYDLALEKIGKIHELLKDGYKDSKELELRADQSLKTIVQQQQDEEMQRMKEENIKKIGEIRITCEKLLNPNITVDQMRECLAPMSQIDVTAPEYVKLISDAERIEKEREQKMAQVKNTQQEVQELQALYKAANQSQNAGLAYKAMKQYRSVIDSSLPDPKKLKRLARSRIKFIEQKISDKTAQSLSLADTFVKEGKLKLAVQSLRDAQAYDPENPGVKRRIETYREELRRQARQLYQEAIIDESYGLVESTETKQGAKDKWKKITELDIDDGEYYRKSVIKLKRYGLL